MATPTNFLQELGIYPKTINDYAVPEPGISDFIKMRRVDAVINGVMRSIIRPILAAKFDIIPPIEKPTPQEKDIAKILKENIVDHKTFKKTLNGIVDDFLTKGSSINEIVLKPNGEGLRLLGNDGLPYRPRENFEEPIDGRDRNGKIKKLIQNAPLRRVPFPRYKLMICVNEAKGTQDWEGTSILLGAHESWYNKSVLQKVFNGGAERFGFGIPYVKAPNPEEYQNKTQEYNEEVSRLAQELRKLQSGANAIMALPHSAEIGVLPFPGGNQDLLKGIQHLERNILTSVLINQTDYMQTGFTENNMKIFVDESLKSVESWAKDITATFNDELITTMVDLNWPGQKRYPKMVVKNIQNNFILSILAYMKQTGMIKVTVPMLRSIFESIDMDADPSEALPDEPQVNNKPGEQNFEGDNNANSNE